MLKSTFFTVLMFCKYSTKFRAEIIDVTTYLINVTTRSVLNY